MLREMTAEQLTEWIAFYQLEPWGILAADEEWAHWKAIYTNAHLKRGKQPIPAKKFLLFTEKEKDAAEIFEADEEV